MKLIIEEFLLMKRLRNLFDLIVDVVVDVIMILLITIKVIKS